MTSNQVLPAIRQILGYIALALAVLALARLAGLSIPSVPGTIEQLALVAIACKMA